MIAITGIDWKSYKQLSVDIINDQIPEVIKNIVDDWKGKDDDYKNILEVCHRLKDCGAVYSKESDKIKIYVNKKSLGNQADFFDMVFYFIELNNNGKIGFSILFKTSSSRQTIRIIKLREINEEEKFVEKIFKKNKYTPIKEKEINVRKIEKGIVSFQKYRENDKIRFSVDEIIPFREVNENKAKVHYYQINNYIANLWSLSFHLVEGIYYQKLGITVKGVVFSRHEAEKDWFISEIKFYPGNTGRLQYEDTFSYSVLQNKTVVESTPSFLVNLEYEQKLELTYNLDLNFRANLWKIKLPNLFREMGSKYILEKTENIKDFDFNEVFTKEFKIEDEKINLLFNYMSHLFPNHKETLKELFVHYIQDEITLELFKDLLEINTDICSEEFNVCRLKVDYVLFIVKKLENFCKVSSTSEQFENLIQFKKEIGKNNAT